MAKQHPDPIDSLAEATGIRMQRLEETVKEADARLVGRLDTLTEKLNVLTEQVGRMAEGLTGLQEETRLTQQTMRETHDRTMEAMERNHNRLMDSIQHNHDQLYEMLRQQWAQQHETTMRLTGIIDALLNRSA